MRGAHDLLRGGDAAPTAVGDFGRAFEPLSVFIGKWITLNLQPGSNAAI